MISVAQHHRCFCPVCDVKFRKYPSHMVFHSFFMKVQLQRDPFVAQTRRNKIQDLILAAGEFADQISFAWTHWTTPR